MTHRFYMSEAAIAGDRFQRMTDSVAKVQNPPRAMSLRSTLSRSSPATMAALKAHLRGDDSFEFSIRRRGGFRLPAGEKLGGLLK